MNDCKSCARNEELIRIYASQIRGSEEARVSQAECVQENTLQLRKLKHVIDEVAKYSQLCLDKPMFRLPEHIWDLIRSADEVSRQSPQDTHQERKLPAAHWPQQQGKRLNLTEESAQERKGVPFEELAGCCGHGPNSNVHEPFCEKAPPLRATQDDNTTDESDAEPRPYQPCKCGHTRAQHIYEEGACRQGAVCPCQHFSRESSNV